MTEESGVVMSTEEPVTDVQATDVAMEPVVVEGGAAEPERPFHHEEDTFDASITEEVVYTPRETAQFAETRAVYIGNLRGPFDHVQLRARLDALCQEAGCEIERAWLNDKFSHAIVIASDVPGAEAIRKGLNNARFPEDGQLPLSVEFIPVKATQLWIDQEIKGPQDGIWRVEFKEVPSKKNPGTTFTVAAHTMVNHSNETWGYKSSSRRPQRRDKRRTEMTRPTNRDRSPRRD